MSKPYRTSDRILLNLKTYGSQPIQQLAERIGLSVPGTRQHLQRLAAEGLVDCESGSGRVGRPAQQWSLSSSGHSRFGDAHAEMTVRLIDSISEMLGETALDRIIAHQYQETLARYRHYMRSASELPHRLEKLVELRCEEGYMAELKKTGPDRWLLFEHHCPICAAASACRGFCKNELKLFRSVLGRKSKITRQEYLLEGGGRCTYLITGI